eukprot:6484939-Amphidinium_carterae.3
MQTCLSARQIWRRARCLKTLKKFLLEWVADTCACIGERDDIFASAWKHLTLHEDEKKLVLRQAYEHYEAGTLFCNSRKNLAIPEKMLEEAIRALPSDKGFAEDKGMADEDYLLAEDD